MIKSRLLFQYRVLTILDLARANDLLVGYGRTSPWNSDINPDPISPYVYTQDEVFGFTRATAKPVIKVDHSTETSITINKIHYEPQALITNTLTELRCDLLLLETELNHNLIQEYVPNTYRSLGFYKNCTTKPEAKDLEFIPTNLVLNADLFYLRHQRPIEITSNAVELIKEIVGV